MFLRVLRESFTRARSRQALAVLAVALGAAVATAMLAVLLDVGDRMSRELRSFGANITVTPAADTLPVEVGGIDYRPVAEGAYIAEELLPQLKMIFWRNNIMAFAPFLYVPAELPGGGRAVLVGTWFDHEFTLSNGERYRTGVRETNPTWKIQGNWPQEGAQETLVGRRLAAQLSLKPGDSFSVTVSQSSIVNRQSSILRISGLLSTGGPEEDQVFVPLALAQQMAGQPGRVRRVEVSALTQPEDAFARRNPDTMSPAERDRWYCTAYVSSIAYQIQETLPGTVAEQVRPVAQNEGEVLRRIRLLMLLVTVAALAASALAVSSATAAVVLERRGEIALMKALGSSEWLVAAFFLAEVGAQGLLGGALGCAAGYFLAGVVGRQVFGTPSSPPLALFPLALAVAVAVAWLGALGPLRAAVKFAPAAVLKEERQ